MESKTFSEKTSEPLKLSIQDVSSEYINKKKEHTIALRHIDLDLPKGSITAILGPSGCGKTTLLRIIAGFQDYGGLILLDGKNIEDVPIQKRGLHYISQNRALYPRLTVFDNIAFPLRMNKTPIDDIRQRVHEIADVFDIELLLTRKPRQLSGGQQQKVALARGIANFASLFLLDEAFSELAPLEKRNIWNTILDIKERYGSTFLFVTHDPKEASAIADCLVIMDKGQILQKGKPSEIASNPLNKEVMDIMGGFGQ